MTETTAYTDEASNWPDFLQQQTTNLEVIKVRMIAFLNWLKEQGNQPTTLKEQDASIAKALLPKPPPDHSYRLPTKEMRYDVFDPAYRDGWRIAREIFSDYPQHLVTIANIMQAYFAEQISGNGWSSAYFYRDPHGNIRITPAGDEGSFSANLPHTALICGISDACATTIGALTNYLSPDNPLLPFIETEEGLAIYHRVMQKLGILYKILPDNFVPFYNDELQLHPLGLEPANFHMVAGVVCQQPDRKLKDNRQHTLSLDAEKLSLLRELSILFFRKGEEDLIWPKRAVIEEMISSPAEIAQNFSDGLRSYLSNVIQQVRSRHIQYPDIVSVVRKLLGPATTQPNISPEVRAEISKKILEVTIYLCRELVDEAEWDVIKNKIKKHYQNYSATLDQSKGIELVQLGATDKAVVYPFWIRGRLQERNQQIIVFWQNFFAAITHLGFFENEELPFLNAIEEIIVSQTARSFHPPSTPKLLFALQ